MIKIAVCDDDSIFLERFSRLIATVYNGDSKAIDCYTNPKELIISEVKYDLIFLDIEMPEINGLELACNYSENGAIIVFVTNMESLVFDAYNTTETFGFIRKSNLREDFKLIIKRLNKKVSSVATIAVKCGSVIIKIRCSDIMYIEKSVNNVIIHTVKGVFSERKTISELEKVLSQYGFERCHIGYLVNTRYIDNVDNTQIVLSNHEKIPLSRRNVKKIKSIFIKRSEYNERYNIVDI